jgi:TonB-dependent starch-binding outer membrane protein SusC
MKQKKMIFLPERKWTRIFLSLVFLMVLSTGMAFAQKPISGKVIDESGAAVPGVSVVVKGTTNGTITDAEGNYTLRVVDRYQQILSFSFIGMITEERLIGDKDVINVDMKSETIGVEEVVVVGFGTRKKE